MARKAISGARARRNVRIAQTAGIALGVAAAAVWALQVPGLEGPLPQKPTLEPVSMPEVKPAGTAQAPPVDGETVVGMAERLEMGARIERVAEAPEPDEDPGPALTKENWKYIAPIREPSRTLAVVGRGTEQKIMWPGREWDGATLVSANEREIVIEDDSGRHTIPRGERAGTGVQWTNIASNAPATNMPSDPAINAAIARGMDPSQYAAQRQAAMDKARRRAQASPLPAHVLAEMGLTEEDAMRMGSDELEAVKEKYQSIVEQRGAAPAATGDDKVKGEVD